MSGYIIACICIEVRPEALYPEMSAMRLPDVGVPAQGSRGVTPTTVVLEPTTWTRQGSNVRGVGKLFGTVSGRQQEHSLIVCSACKVDGHTRSAEWQATA